MSVCVVPHSSQYSQQAAAGRPAPAVQRAVQDPLGQQHLRRDDLCWRSRSHFLHGEAPPTYLSVTVSVDHTLYWCLFINMLCFRATLAVLWSVRRTTSGLWLVSSPGEAAVALPPLLPSTPVSPSSVPGPTRSSPPTKSSEAEPPSHTDRH